MEAVLQSTVAQLIASGKGILAADESVATVGKRVRKSNMCQLCTVAVFRPKTRLLKRATAAMGLIIMHAANPNMSTRFTECCTMVHAYWVRCCCLP